MCKLYIRLDEEVVLRWVPSDKYGDVEVTASVLRTSRFKALRCRNTIFVFFFFYRESDYFLRLFQHPGKK